jgi:large subunit ribosomal protein L21
MFAIIKTGGKQYRVAPQDVITVGRLAGDPGDVVKFGEVLLVGGENVTVGSPTVAGATVEGQLVDHTRGAKVIAFKKRRRKNSRRRRGHRQDYTVIRITDILTDGKSASTVAHAGEQAEAAPAVDAAGPGPTQTPVEAPHPAEAVATEAAPPLEATS